MSIAKGSKSVVAWKEEATLGVAPSGNWNQLPVNNETLDENIETVQSQDIRSDRRNPSLRGGNIATGGNITHDFGPNRTPTLFKHLLAASAITTTTITPATLSAASFKRGDYCLNADGDLFICIQGGDVVAGDLSDLDLVTAGDTTLTNTIWRYVADTGYAFSLYKHVITAGIDLPSVGLAFEKGILGGTTAKHVQFVGGRLNTLDLTVPQSGIVTANWGALFTGSTDLGASAGYGTPTIEAETAFSGGGALVHLNDTSFIGGVDQVGRGIFREFSMQLTNGIDENTYVINSRYRADLPEGTRKGSGRMSLYFVDGTEYGYFKNETKVNMGVSFVHDGRFFIIRFPEVKLTGSGTPKISGQGAMQADFDWTAFFEDAPEDYDVEVEFHNQLATPIV